MTAGEFIEKWENEKNVKDDRKAVGICIHWRNIPLDSKVLQFSGKDAWGEMEKFYAPVWGNFKRTILREWLNSNRPDYQKFIKEEQEKINFYRENGLTYYNFPAFADATGELGVLGDGNHRFIDCNYLIMEGKDFQEDIKKVRLDILCVNDLRLILSPNDFPPGINVLHV